MTRTEPNGMPSSPTNESRSDFDEDEDPAEPPHPWAGLAVSRWKGETRWNDARRIDEREKALDVPGTTTCSAPGCGVPMPLGGLSELLCKTCLALAESVD